MSIDLAKLAEPFSLDDIEWRVSRIGRGQKGNLYCMVLAYITARAIQKRLDDICGPENWRLEPPRMIDVNGKSAFVCGLGVRIGVNDSSPDFPTVEWVTKWDVSEPTNIEPAKGGWSGAMKRAGAQWGIGRYLYYLDETYVELAEKKPAGARGWNRAKLSQEHGGGFCFWKTPSLPGWALPKDPEHEISKDELGDLKQAWRRKFANDVKSPADLGEGFARFVTSISGDFPTDDYACWTRLALDQCTKRIEATTDPNGVSADVPFDE